MQNGVEPYLAAHAEEFYWERESGHPIHVLRYRAFRPRGVVVISHGFTENAEKYKEIVYYFIKEHFHVYLPEHCGHGKSYRLVDDPSLVYVDSYHRYVEDLLFVARKAKAEACGLPLVLYSHSMGGGIAAAAAAKAPHLFRKVVLSSPMIRPLTGKVPFADAKRIAAFACATERGTQYVVGQKPYPLPSALSLLPAEAGKRAAVSPKCRFLRMAPCRRASVPRSDAERMETDRGSCPFISGGERSSCVQPCPGADDPENGRTPSRHGKNGKSTGRKA